MKPVLLLMAAGSGSRMGAAVNKVLLPLHNEPIFIRALRPFLPLVSRTVIVTGAGDVEAVRFLLKCAEIHEETVSIVSGGKTRQESVRLGLAALSQEEDPIVLIHDAARPFVDGEIITSVVKAAETYGAAIPGVAITDTVKETAADGVILRTVPRQGMFTVQTPQAARLSLLCRAHDLGRSIEATDDAALLEAMGVSVHIVSSSPNNFKMTTPEDMARASSLLARQAASDFRVGHGYDVHRLVPSRPLILCGVNVPSSVGLLGHSDADVALHALMDAMLGAAALGDIGHLFPDTDEQYRGADSLVLLERVRDTLACYGFTVMNADVTIIAQAPKLAPYIREMRENVARTLRIPCERVSVKATTTEGLGLEGRKEGIAAHSVVLIGRNGE